MSCRAWFPEEIQEWLIDEALAHWQAREEELGTETKMRDLERFYSAAGC